MSENYRDTANRVLGMLQRADGNDPSRGHLTMNNWEWPTGVALYGIYKTYQQSGDQTILDYLTGWYDDMLSREQKPHRNVNTVAPVLTLTCLYQETKNERYLPVIESWIDWVMQEMPRTEYGGLQHCTVWNKHYQQLWCDTLFMVCLFLAKAGVVLERPELIEEAEYQFLMHIRYLQNKVSGLFYHDENGAPCGRVADWADVVDLDYSHPELWEPGVLDQSMLPAGEGWQFVYSLDAPTCRLLNQPYDPEDVKNTQYYVIDGFIISPNVELVLVENLGDLDFANSDHNPVHIQVTLK